MGLYSALPPRKRLWGRRLTQFLIGGYMIVYLSLMQRENMQIEGSFFYVLVQTETG